MTVSLASEPPDVKTTRVSPLGAIRAMREASRAAGCDAKPSSVGA
jgi:hypothetical protein